MKKLVAIPKHQLCKNCGVGRLRIFAVTGGQVAEGDYIRNGQIRCTVNGSPDKGCGYSKYICQDFVGVWWPEEETVNSNQPSLFDEISN